MYAKRIILAGISCLFSICLFAQDLHNEQEATAESARLYNEKKWKELVEFGKATQEAGVDFPLLRMRIGYASFVLGNYGESLKQYEYVYRQDNENKTALYYCYLNNAYLNNSAACRYYGAKMPEETRTAEKFKATKISALNLEFSYKIPDHVSRGNAQYFKAGIQTELGYRLQWQNAFAMYNQSISEPLLTSVNNNRNIKIAQKEYYTRLNYAVTGHVSLIGGFHYLYTPFNNFIYNNYIGFGGIKFTTPFVHLQLLEQRGRIRDSSYQQVDAVVNFYPLGNTKLYTITRGSFSKETAFTQVIGYRILKKMWLEGNVTVGKYSKLLGNDAMYVYDDIDIKKLRAGASVYLLAGKTTTVTINYNFDRKELYGRPNINFNQQSITGGLQWNF